MLKLWLREVLWCAYAHDCGCCLRGLRPVRLRVPGAKHEQQQGWAPAPPAPPYEAKGAKTHPVQATATYTAPRNKHTPAHAGGGGTPYAPAHTWEHQL